MTKYRGFTPGYHAHTSRTRRLVVEAELRACWELLVVIRGMLMVIEEHGGPAVLKMLPGERYRLARVAQNTCKRAHKLLAELDRIAAESESETRVRAQYLSKVRRSRREPSESSVPAWHTAALRAISDLAAVPEFSHVAIATTWFDGYPRGEHYDAEPVVPGRVVWPRRLFERLARIWS